MPQGFFNALGALRRDLFHAARSLRKEKAFTLVCVVSLGIGIGAMVALATFGRGVIAPARGINPQGLTEVLVVPEGPLLAKAGVWALEQWSYPDFQVLRDSDTGMSITGWVQETSEFGIKVPDEKETRRVTTLYVTANYFNTFEVSLAKGAGFDPRIDDAASAEARTVLSHDFWKVQTNSDPDIVGKTVTINNIPHVVVGVTPENFFGHFHFFQSPGSLVFVPLERHPRLKANPNIRDDRTIDWVRVHARLKPGVDIKSANALVSTIAAGLKQRYPSTNQYKGATVASYVSMGAVGAKQSTQVLTIMLGLAGSVLLVVCLNISGMMLVRGTKRERELSIRAALGAARQRLIQHLFFEALWLAVIAAAISAFVLFGIPAIAGWYLGFPVPEEFDLDATNMVIAAGLCLLVSLMFGLMPAVRFSRPNLITAMKEEAGGGGNKTIRVHRIAAMVQVAIAVPFLVVSGVMIDRARTADLGFPTDGLVAAKLPPPAAGAEKDVNFSIRRVREMVRQADAVQSVAVAEGMPVDFDYREFRVTSGDKSATAHVTRIGEDFLETVGVPLARGRTISIDDRLSSAQVAVLSQPLADVLFPGAEAIGERVTFIKDDQTEEEFTVVGVTKDFASSQMTTTRLQIMLPMPEDFTSTVHLITRGAPGDEPKLRAALEVALKELGVESQPGVAFSGIVVGQDLLDKSLQDLIAEGTAVGVAGGLVLVLAALGILGVVGFMVATRTKEIAVRMALGSTRLRVFRMMLFDIVKLVVPGVAAGVVIGAVFIRMVEDVLGTPLRVGPDALGAMEPVIYAGASAIAVAAAILAGLPAARRATKVPPMVAIKAE